MGSANNWAAAAAAELSGETVHSMIVQIIEKHCPFERGVAYMPVPRCDSCRFWRAPDSQAERQRIGSGPRIGACELLEADSGRKPTEPRARVEFAYADFGCVQHEPKEIP